MQNSLFSVKVKSGPGVSNSCVLLHDKTISFGRHHDNDCVLSNDAGISRKHFEIFFEQEKCWIKDLNSRNGTYLNDHSILSSELTAGDEIRVGSTRLVVNVSNNEQATNLNITSRLGPKVSLMVRDNDSTTVIAQRHLHSAKFAQKVICDEMFQRSFFDLPGRVMVVHGDHNVSKFEISNHDYERIANQTYLFFHCDLESLREIIESGFGSNSIILMNHTCSRSQLTSHVRDSISIFGSPNTFLDEYQELPQELANAMLNGIDLVICETSEADVAAAIFEKRHASWIETVFKNLS